MLEPSPNTEKTPINKTITITISIPVPRLISLETPPTVFFTTLPTFLTTLVDCLVLFFICDEVELFPPSVCLYFLDRKISLLTADSY